MELLKNRLNRKKYIGYIWLIYVSAVILYLLAAVHMTVPVHLKVDEELYLAMAKSFHQKGSFQKGYEYINYSCVLYPMLISLEYYFYSPETIMTVLRSINVIVMCSAVFPVYLLSKKILTEKKAILIAVFSMLIPDMIDSVYLMQEVFLYPILMWCFYFIYMDFEKGNWINRYSVLSIVGLATAFFIKTNTLVLIAAYMLVVILGKKDRRKITKSICAAGIWTFVVLCGQIGIWILNAGQGSNHYASQIQHLFPITAETVIAGISGLIFYILFFIFCSGVLPVILPAIYQKEYSEIDRKFLGFVYSAIGLMLLEIVVTIFLTEEHGSMVPHKFLFRYFFGLTIPLFIMLGKIEINMWKKKKWILGSYGLVGVYIAVYYAIIGTETRTAIMDSHITLLLENINKYVCNGFPVYVMALFVIGSFIGIGYIIKKKNVQFLIRLFWKMTGLSVIVMCMINIFQHPYYSNQIAGGEENKNRFVELAEYLKKDDVKIYYLSDKLDNGALFYGYIWQDYKWVGSMDELKDIEERCVVVTSEEFLEDQKIENLSKEIEWWVK